MAYIKPKMLSVLMTVVACLVSSSAQAVTVQVFGDAGWDSGDTRAAGYLNNNNPPDNQLIRGRPRADNPLLLEDTLIEPRLSFGIPPVSPPVGPGALKLVTGQSGDKATLDKDTSPFGGVISPFDPDTAFSYAWLRISDPTPTVAAPALKLGIDTTEANPAGDKAADRGEERFDKILVYEPYHQATTVDDLWTIETVTATQGLFWLVNLDPVGSTLPATNQADLRTLDEWSTVFNASGLGLDAKIDSIQLGIGSGNPELDTYVDYLEFTSGSGTTQWNFGVPEPTTASLLGLLGSALLRRQSR
jgi:hypothetical protein